MTKKKPNAIRGRPKKVEIDAIHNANQEAYNTAGGAGGNLIAKVNSEKMEFAKPDQLKNVQSEDTKEYACSRCKTRVYKNQHYCPSCGMELGWA